MGIVIVAEGSLFLWYGGGLGQIMSYLRQNSPSPQGIILFSGSDCSQCAKVDDFIKANNVASKVPFTELEIFHNVHNANILADKAQICGLGPQDYGVPFLWDGKSCIIGYVDVITFFQKNLKLVKSLDSRLQKPIA